MTWIRTATQFLSIPPVKMTNDPHQKSTSWQRLSAGYFTTTGKGGAMAAALSFSLQVLDFSVEN